MAYPYLNNYTMAKNGVALVAGSRLLVHPTDATPDIPSGGEPMYLSFTFNGGNNSVAIGNFWMRDRYRTNLFHPTAESLVGSVRSRYYYQGTVLEDPSRWENYTNEQLSVFNGGGQVAVPCEYSTIAMTNKFTPTYFSFMYQLVGGGRNDKFDVYLWFNGEVLGHAANLMPTSTNQHCILVNTLEE
jgi:hypothetical protein